MCGPTAALAFTAISTVGTAYSQVQQNKAAQEQAKYQSAQALAQQDALNSQALHSQEQAKIADRAADETREEGQKAQLAFLRRSRAIEQQTRQNFAGRGVFTESDSALDEINLQQQLAQADTDTIFDQFERQALGYQQQGRDLLFQAEQQLKGSAQAGLSAQFIRQSAPSTFGGVGGILASGAAQGFGQYSDFKESGAFAKSVTQPTGRARARGRYKNFFGGARSIYNAPGRGAF